MTLSCSDTARSNEVAVRKKERKKSERKGKEMIERKVDGERHERERKKVEGDRTRSAQIVNKRAIVLFKHGAPHGRAPRKGLPPH